jgi:hypothetical protein
MTASIPLITAVDGFEAVRNAVAAIIAAEQAAQQTKATAAGQDPALWKLRTYIERACPWEMFRDGVSDLSPVINVWYDSSSTDMNASDLSARQMTSSTIHVDCIGYAESAASGAGFVAGDEAAARVAQRAARLIRGILMHGKYRYLGLPDVVGRRYLQSRTMFQPTNAADAVQRVVGCRLTFSVDHIETIGIEEYNEIEQIFVTMQYTSDGEVIAEMDIDVSVPA